MYANLVLYECTSVRVYECTIYTKRVLRVYSVYIVYEVRGHEDTRTRGLAILNTSKIHNTTEPS